MNYLFSCLTAKIKTENIIQISVLCRSVTEEQNPLNVFSFPFNVLLLKTAKSMPLEKFLPSLSEKLKLVMFVSHVREVKCLQTLV